MHPCEITRYKPTGDKAYRLAKLYNCDIFLSWGTREGNKAGAPNQGKCNYVWLESE